MVNSSQNAAYNLRTRTSRPFSGVGSGNVSAELSRLVAIVIVCDEVESKGLRGFELSFVSGTLCMLIVIARLRLLKFFSLSSFPQAARS